MRSPLFSAPIPENARLHQKEECQMRRLLSSISMRSKILLGNLVLLALLLVPSLIVYIDVVKKAVESQTTYMEQMNAQANMNVDLLFSSLDRINFIHYSDGELRRILLSDASEENSVTRFENDTYLRSALFHAFRNDSFIPRGGIVNKYGNAYCSVISDAGEYQVYVEQLTGQISWAEDPYKAYFTGVYEAVIQQSAKQVVTMIQRLYYFGSYVGTVCVDVRYEALATRFDRIYDGDSISSLCVIGADGTVLVLYSSPSGALTTQLLLETEAMKECFSADAGRAGNTLSLEMLQGREYRIAGVRNSTTGWVVLQYASMETLHQMVFQGIQNMVLVFAAVLVLAVVFSVFMSRQLIKPLRQMIADIRLTEEGHLSPLHVPPHIQKTEVGALMQYYNTMIRRVNQGIDHTLLYKLNRKRIELKMLQYQINPHFLYNTLNTISALAEIGGVPQIIEITDNLSGLLRYNVQEQDVVPIADELRFARNYLQIQDIRFPGRFRMELLIPPDVGRGFMLKFLLQPMVENYFTHGLRDKRVNVQIPISGRREDGDIYLSIYDNGTGMSAQVCAGWNRRLQDGDSRDKTDNIGLINVNARIRSFYGAPYGGIR